MEVRMPLNWSIDLTEIDDVQADVIYSNEQLNGVTLKAKQDMGAQINVMSMTVFKDIQKVQKLPLFPKSCIKFVGYRNRPIEYLGTTKLECIHNGTKVNSVFYVTNVMDRKIILVSQLCIELGLIVTKCDDECQCKNLTVAEANAADPIRKQQEAVDQNSTPPPPVSLDTEIDSTNPKAHIMHLFPDLFEGVGTICDTIVHLDVWPEATPIVCSPRRVSDALLDDLKIELDRMESMKVIHKLDINEASDWVHALVLVMKLNGRLCVCLDPRTLNTVLGHNIHNTQRFIDIVAQIRGFTHCSKIDANSGFRTLPLDADSQLFMTFDTLWGRYCFLKLPFGLCESQYFFQFYTDLNFKTINNGTHVIADGVLIVGNSSKARTGNHDHWLIQVLNKCCEIGLKLNADKCTFKSTHVLFFRHLITSKGLKPDPRKIDAIVQMPVPQNKAKLQSFIGLCNYLTCYVPHLTDVLLPLCAVTAKASEFQWEKLHSDAFARAKQVIANSCTLQYFNSEDPIVIQVNASSIGVGAALLQQGCIVSYHSRALMPKQRYSNIKCEYYGLVNCIEHFHHYILAGILLCKQTTSHWFS